MNNRKHIIVCSHGFGVKKDDRGLFPDVGSALENIEIVTFDYNSIDDLHQTIAVKPLSEEVKKLHKVLSDIKKSDPNAIIDLLCHSQGCTVTALLRPIGVRKMVFLAPPYTFGSSLMIERVRKNPNSQVNLAGTSKLARRDGSTTLVPKEYWEELETVDPLDLYNNLSKITELIIINANQDDVLGKVSPGELSPAIKVINIDGDHNFTGVAREPLKKLLKGMLL